MTDVQIAWIIGGVLIAAICVSIPLIIRDIRKSKASVAGEGGDEVMATSVQKTDATLHAVVVDMACDVGSIGYQGYKMPKAVKAFVIRFKSDEGEIFDVRVSEDMYSAFEVGLCGMLTITGGNIDSFEPDDGMYEDEGELEGEE